MHPNPAFAQLLARDRVADLRHAAQTGAARRDDARRARVLQAARHGAGWLLVDVGLRLALPRGALKPTARAHR